MPAHVPEIDMMLGQQHTLPVTKELDFGFYLDTGELGEVLLPRRYAPPGLKTGDELRVFLYLDSEDRPIATTETPKAEVGQFACLECVSTSRVGAFLDWGLSKDVLVPFPEQHRRMQPGQSYIVHLYVDRVHQRITASSRIDRFLGGDRQGGFSAGQQVDLLIADRTDMGVKAIVDHRQWGLIHRSDIHRPLQYGQRLAGFIKRVRPDGRLDLSLEGSGERHDQSVEKVLAALARHDGFLPLHDRSPPEAIQAELGMSKAAFKKAIGSLFKAGQVTLEPDGTRLKVAP